MTAARKTVAIRIGILVAVLGLMAWFIFWRTGQAWQYEVVQEGVLYRCSARTPEEFAAGAMKVYPAGMVIAGTSAQMAAPPLTAAINYGHKNRTRATTVRVEADQVPTADQIKRFTNYLSDPRRLPALLVDADGRTAGMLVAAYRLNVMKLPLEEVLKLAANEDAPADVIEQVRKYARDYAENPAGAPATAPSGMPPLPASPLGPAVPE